MEKKESDVVAIMQKKIDSLQAEVAKLRAENSIFRNCFKGLP